LKYESFIELNRYLIELFEKSFKPITWNGLRLIAIDGTLLQLPKFKEISDHFGIWKVRNADPCVMARASQLFDPLNKLSISSVITPKSIDERDHAARLFLNLMPNDLVLLDRGYPAFWIFKLLSVFEAHFCARLKSNWKDVQKFLASNKRETTINLFATPNSMRQCLEIGVDIRPIKLRLIRIELDSGEIEVLGTTLMNKRDFPYEVFADLYHNRWPVEEDYKYVKNWIEMENFSGKTVLSVYQDFYARFFSKNLASILAFDARENLREAGVKIKYEHQINFAHALSKCKNVIPLIFQRTREKMIELIRDIHDLISRTTEPVRPGRSFPRNHKTNRRKYYLNYKRAS